MKAAMTQSGGSCGIIARDVASNSRHDFWVVYGALSAASMLPLTFPDKRVALLGAFINWFSIGFVIRAVALPWPGWLSGLTIGLLLSLADAIITKAYAPIMIFGAIGGMVIGWIVQRFGH